MSNTNTALAPVNRDDDLILGHTREEIEAYKDTIKASNQSMTDAQFTVFMAAARHLGLDPLARQIVPIFQGGRMTVQTTIDGFRVVAARSGKYRGQIGPLWCGKDGQWKDVWLEDTVPPAAAKVGVKRSDFDEPMWGVARFKSYAKGDNWQKMPDVMIAKVAESLALRKAFPNELSGTYTDDEMVQAFDEGQAPVMPAYTTTITEDGVSTPRPAPAEKVTVEVVETDPPKTRKTPAKPPVVTEVSKETRDQLAGIAQANPEAFAWILQKYYPQYNKDHTFGANMTADDAESILLNIEKYLEEYFNAHPEEDGEQSTVEIHVLDEVRAAAVQAAVQETPAPVTTPPAAPAPVTEEVLPDDYEALYTLFGARAKAKAQGKEHTQALFNILARSVKPWDPKTPGKAIRDVYSADDLKKALRLIARYDTEKTPGENTVALIPDEVAQIA